MNPRLASSVLAIAALATCSLLPAQADAPDAVRSPDRAVIEESLAELRHLVREGIETKAPSASIWKRQPGATIFDGSYDWHSCIAAHWAGLSLARLTPDPDLARELLARLGPEALQAERELRLTAVRGPARADGPADAAAPRAGTITAGPQQMFAPYVDAWTLLLLDELAKHDGRDTADLRAFRLETEARLLDHLAGKPFPESRTRGEAPEPVVLGSYRSWLFGYLALRIAGTRGDGAAARLDAIAAEKLDPHRELLAAYAGRQPSDFFDVRSLYWLVAWFEGGERRPSLPPSVDFTRLPDSVTLRTVHVVGLCASEAWPAAVLARGDDAARRRFEARTAEILGRRDLWADDFTVVSHWMPQFLWFGLWLAHGRP